MKILILVLVMFFYCNDSIGDQVYKANKEVSNCKCKEIDCIFAGKVDEKILINYFFSPFCHKPIQRMG